MLTGDRRSDVLAARAPVMTSLDAGPLHLEEARDSPGRVRAALPPSGGLPSARPASPPRHRCWSCWRGGWRGARGVRSPSPRPGCPAAAGRGPGASWWACVIDNPTAAAALGVRIRGCRPSRGQSSLLRRYDRAELAVQHGWAYRGADGRARPGSPEPGRCPVLGHHHAGDHASRPAPGAARCRIRAAPGGAPAAPARQLRRRGAGVGRRLEPRYPVVRDDLGRRHHHPPIRYLSRPDVTAFEGTEQV